MKSKESKSEILRIIAKNLVIANFDGRRLIYTASDVFKASIDKAFTKWGLNRIGVATPITSVNVFELIDDAKFIDLFGFLPGPWRQKYLSQNQIVEFCENFPEWLRQGFTTMFLCKINETEDVDELNPGDNLVVVDVGVNPDGLHIYVSHLDDKHMWSGACHRHVVVPVLV